MWETFQLQVGLLSKKAFIESDKMSLQMRFRMNSMNPGAAIKYCSYRTLTVLRNQKLNWNLLTNKNQRKRSIFSLVTVKKISIISLLTTTSSLSVPPGFDAASIAQKAGNSIKNFSLALRAFSSLEALRIPQKGIKRHHWCLRIARVLTGEGARAAIIGKHNHADQKPLDPGSGPTDQPAAEPFFAPPTTTMMMVGKFH